MKRRPVTLDTPRAAIAILLALGIIWTSTKGRCRGGTRAALALLTGTRTRSPLRRALSIARAAGLVETRLLRDGRPVYSLTDRGAEALHSLGVKP